LNHADDESDERPNTDDADGDPNEIFIEGFDVHETEKEQAYADFEDRGCGDVCERGKDLILDGSDVNSMYGKDLERGRLYLCSIYQTIQRKFGIVSSDTKMNTSHSQPRCHTERQLGSSQPAYSAISS
jgi:hypothetical protein